MHPATPAPALRALHARRQRPRARQGSRPGCRRADPGPGGRGRARRQATGARAGGRRLAGRRLRPSRMRGAHQRAGHAVGLDDARALAPPAPTPCCCPGRKPGPAGRWRGHWTRPARPPTFPWAMCETPLGFLRLDAIAGHPGWRPWSWARRTWSRICMRATRRAARKRCWRVRWPSWPPAPTDWRRWMACTWTWTMRRAWRWPASKAATRASTARR